VREAGIEKRCVEWARNRGWLVFKLDARSTIGSPDRVFYHPAAETVRFIEFKQPGGRLSPTQVYTLSLLGKAAHVCYSFEEFKEILCNTVA
jgi:hypothetical protein